MGGIGDGVIGHLDPARHRGLQARDRAQQRRLADAVRPAQDQRLPGQQGKGHPFHRPQSPARDGKVMDGQQCHRGSKAQATRRPSDSVTL